MIKISRDSAIEFAICIVVLASVAFFGLAAMFHAHEVGSVKSIAASLHHDLDTDAITLAMFNQQHQPYVLAGDSYMNWMESAYRRGMLDSIDPPYVDTWDNRYVIQAHPNEDGTIVFEVSSMGRDSDYGTPDDIRQDISSEQINEVDGTKSEM